MGRKLLAWIKWKGKKYWSFLVVLSAISIGFLTILMLVLPALTITVSDSTLVTVQSSDPKNDKTTSSTELAASQEDESSADFILASQSLASQIIAGETYQDFSSFLTNLSYKEAKVDTATQSVSVKLNLAFQVNRESLAKGQYYLQLPADSSISKDIELGKVYNGYDHLGKAAFTYRFVQDSQMGLVTLIMFDDQYVEELGTEEASGYIQYNALFGEKSITNDGSLIVSFHDSQQITIPANELPVINDLKVEKTSDVHYEKNQPVVSYTVWIKSKKGTPGSIQIQDTLTATGLEGTSIERLSIEKGTQQEYGSYRKEDTLSAEDYEVKLDSKGNWSMTLPALGSSGSETEYTTYKVSYTERLTGLTGLTKASAKNEVVVSSTYEKTQQKISDQQSVTNDFYLQTVQKSGYYDSQNGEFVWTINVNQNGNNITGSIVQDSYFAQATEMTVTPNSGYQKKWTDGKLTGLTFVATKNDSNNQTYTISYRTKALATGWQDQTVENEAQLDIDGDLTTPDIVKSEAKVTVPSNGRLTKEFVQLTKNDAGTQATIRWKLTITPATTMIFEQGTEFTDQLMSQWSQDATKHWYTKKQATAIYQAYENYFGKGTIHMTVQKEDWASIDMADMTDQTRATSYKITLNQEIKRKELAEISYESTSEWANSYAAENQLYTNSSVPGTTAQAKERVTKMDGNEQSGTTNIDSGDGVVTWKIRVALTQDDREITVNDQLPSDLTLIEMSYGQHYVQDAVAINNNLLGTSEGYHHFENVKVSGSISDQSVKLILISDDNQPLIASLSGEKELYITVRARYSSFKKTSEEQKEFTNRVEVKANNQSIGTAEQTQKVTFKGDTVQENEQAPVQKAGQWDAMTNQLHYQVLINPDATDLLNGSEELTLTDTLIYYNANIGVSIALISSSMKLTTLDGERIDSTKWSWSIESDENEYGNHTWKLKIKLKDATAYRLSYSYQLTQPPTDIDHTQTWVQNTATLEGTATASDSTMNAVKWQEVATDAGIRSQFGYTFIKVDQNSYQTVLSKAVFGVYEVDKDGKRIDQQPKRTLTTDQSGKVSLSASEFINGTLKKDTIYQIVEINAPTGYQLPEEKEAVSYYVYYSENSTDSWRTFPNQGANLVNLAKRSQTVYVANQKKTTTAITVKKRWLTASGEETNRTSLVVFYHLIQITTDAAGNQSEQPYGESRSLSQTNNWTDTQENLPISKDGNRYTYRVIEEELVGYQTSYRKETMNNGTEWIITNQATTSYSLPKTGGKGTEGYLRTGSTFIISSTVMYMIVKRKKKRKLGKNE